MQLTICEKHQKKQKSGLRILSGSSVCVNRYCPNAYKIICGQCKNDHRDHSIKILTLEDINQLIKRLLKAPFTLSNKYISQSIEIMKKIKLIKEFRRKIDILETDMVRQAVKFIDLTQTLIHEYAVSKQAVIQLAEKLQRIAQPEVYGEFKKSCREYLSQIDYNFKKERMEYGNLTIKENQEKRRKLLDITKRRIEEVKDYSMKIIEVILNNDDSEEEDQNYTELINQKKKDYQILKEELNSQPQQQDESQDHDLDQQHSKSTSVSANYKKYKENIDQQMQTEDQWITGLRQQVIRTKIELQSYKKKYSDQLNELKDENKLIIKDKQILKNEIITMKQQLEAQKKTFKHFHQRLIQNKDKQQQISVYKQNMLRKIIQVQNR